MGSKRTHLADEPIKRARFYRNGDIHFSGVDIAISKKRFKSFDSLLNELTYKVSLPCGVRHISTPGGVHQIEKLDEINDGDKYVCSTYRSIKKLDYLGIMDSKPAWAASSTKPKYFSKHSYHEPVVSKPGNFQPKPITVIAKNDSKNRAKIVLTKKVAMCYESLLRVIDETLQMSTGCVKDLYTLQGKKVSCKN